MWAVGAIVTDPVSVRLGRLWAACGGVIVVGVLMICVLLPVLAGDGSLDRYADLVVGPTTFVLLWVGAWVVASLLGVRLVMLLHQERSSRDLQRPSATSVLLLASAVTLGFQVPWWIAASYLAEVNFRLGTSPANVAWDATLAVVGASGVAAAVLALGVGLVMLADATWRRLR